MMREGAPKTIYRKDYTEPDFLISHVELAFEIADGNTQSRAHFASNAMVRTRDL